MALSADQRMEQALRECKVTLTLAEAELFWDLLIQAEAAANAITEAEARHSEPDKDTLAEAATEAGLAVVTSTENTLLLARTLRERIAHQREHVMNVLHGSYEAPAKPRLIDLD